MSGEPNVKGVTVTELKAIGWTEVQRFMPDEEILDLFPDNGSAVANPLLRRAQAAEAEIERLTAEAVSLRHLAADAVLMARHGEYSNGVTDPTGMIDEGSVKAGEIITDLDRRAVALNVTVGSILYDHTLFYGQAAEAAKGVRHEQ